MELGGRHNHAPQEHHVEAFGARGRYEDTLTRTPDRWRVSERASWLGRAKPPHATEGRAPTAARPGAQASRVAACSSRYLKCVRIALTAASASRSRTAETIAM
jgi:hypothetical protein